MYRLFFALLVFGPWASAEAAQPARTWEFELKTPGTYEVHVHHRYNEAAMPRGSEATYSFQTSEKTVTRDLSVLTRQYPTIVLIADTARPQKARVVISGLPRLLLQQTDVYVVEANTRYPYEWLDPKKSLDLPSAKQLRRLLSQPAEQIDLAIAKLTIDKEIDPTVNVHSGLQKIDEMVAKIRTMSGFGISKNANLDLLRRYIYEPGEWNDYRVFEYDLEDPLGANIHNKLLTTYIATKKGNCVTMPLLFVILGRRLGIDVTAAVAPMHVFVKAKDEYSGAWYNLETTSGAKPARDVWLREQMPMTDQAVANGIYLRPLPTKETVALMGTTLAEHYADQKEFEKVITIADVVLEYSPKNVTAMLMKANAYYDLSSKYYLTKYRSIDEIPERAQGHYKHLLANNRLWGSKAEALGWRAPSKSDEEQYLQSVKKARTKTVN